MIFTNPLRNIPKKVYIAFLIATINSNITSTKTHVKYYVYIYFDPRIRHDSIILENIFEFEPFYVGKGTKNRLFDHLSLNEKSKQQNSIKYGKIQHLQELNLSPIIVKIKDGLSNEEANNLEKLIISQIGTIAIINGIKRGPLSNLTAGGDGGSQSLETRQKMSKNRRGKGTGPRPESVKQKISKSISGIPKTHEHKMKIAQSKIGYSPTEETRKKLSVASSNRIHSEETKQKIRDKQKGIPRPYAIGNKGSSGLIHINNGTRGKQIHPEELTKYLSQGWCRGKFKRQIQPNNED